MTKANIAQWDTVAADNTDINDISLAENVMKPPAVNNAFRETMAQVANLFASSVAFSDPQKEQFLANIGALALDASNLSTAAQKGAALSGLGAGVLAGFRNKIINGDFVVNENNASVVLQRYVIDRWYHDWNGSGGSPTVSRQTHTPGQTDVPGNPTFFLRMAQGSAPSSQTRNMLIQRIEDAGTLAGQKATFTIYLKAGANLTLPGLHIIQNFGGGGGTGSNVVVASNLALTTSWQKFTFTVDIPSVTGGLLGSATWLEYGIDLPLNSTWTIDFSRASLVAGDATGEDDPFSPRHPQQELALCQRYYRTISHPTSRELPCSVYKATNPFGLRSSEKLDPPMISAPSATFVGAVEWFNIGAGSFAATATATINSAAGMLGYDFTVANTAANYQSILVRFTLILDAEL